MQRSVRYGTGVAGAIHDSRNPVVRGVVTKHQRVVQLFNQSQASDMLAEGQALAGEEEGKILKVVTSSATLWNGDYDQIV